MATQPERASSRVKTGAFRYHVEIDLNSDSAHAAIIQLVGQNKRVLELGCGTGHMSRVLREFGCSVTAIEIDALAAETASTFCNKMVVGDLDQMNLDQQLDGEEFDVIVAADVLEHLKQPAAVLRSVKKFLRPDGYVLVSIPNVAHISVRLALLGGRFPDGDTGLLDRTHLRFFTRESLERLFEQAGIAIGHFQRIEVVPPDPPTFEVPYDPSAVPSSVIEALSRDPEASTYQFVVLGYPLPRTGLNLVQDRMKRLAQELEVARKENVDLRKELKQLNELCAREVAAVSQHSQRAANDLRSEFEGMLQARETQWKDAAERNQQALHALQAEIQVLSDEKADAERVRIAVEERSQALIEETTAHRENVVHWQERANEAHVLVARKQRELDELSLSFESARTEAASLRETLGNLERRTEILSGRERDLREMLLEAHDQLHRRDENINSTRNTALPSETPQATIASMSAKPGSYLQYQLLLQRIRDLVRNVAPEGAKVLVISKGDDDMLRLGSCHALHFPQREDGVYAGYHPADDDAAIRHLRELRERGAQFLLIPEPSRWWLQHYTKFSDHLNRDFKRVVDEPGVGVMFDITGVLAPPTVEVPAVVAPPVPETKEFGANLSGHVTSEKGVGEGVRATIRAFRAANIPLVLNNFIDSGSMNLDSDFAVFSKENPYSVNLLHMNADEVPIFRSERGEDYFKERYNIGYWAWELSHFPDKWLTSFCHVDELWVPSTFVLDSVARSSPVPVVKVPHALPETLPVTKHGRSYFGLPEAKYIFLFMFDFMSIMERKNPLGLIEAFKKAFRPSDRAVLVIKGAHSGSSPQALKALQQAAKGLNVRMLDTVLTKQETNSLINACDCYVSLHRSEGFGLTMAEAMSLEKPVIATGYSGNMDFMTTANSFPVNYKLVPLPHDYDPYDKGCLWADPDLNHAAELMRFVYDHKDRATRAALRARHDIVQQFSPGAVAQIVLQRFARLAAFEKLAVPEKLLEAVEVSAARLENASYRELIREIQIAVVASTTAGSTIAVISRGDQELLRIEGRTGWHFPREEDGTYAGHHPAHSESAITQLETLRSKGLQFLVIPQTASWWLDYYSGFRSHLDSQYRRLYSDENCIIFSLGRRARRHWRIRDRVLSLK